MMAITVFCPRSELPKCEFCGATRAECPDRDNTNCPNLYRVTEDLEKGGKHEV